MCVCVRDRHCVVDDDVYVLCMCTMHRIGETIFVHFTYTCTLMEERGGRAGEMSTWPAQGHGCVR
jgi:hypothetical protein